MKNSKLLLMLTFILVVIFLLIKCAPKNWEVSPIHLGTINFPEDNLPDQNKANFGRALFFDKRLSIDSTISCVVCHKPGLAFTDGLPKSEGVMGRIAKRNSPTLFNMAYQPYFMGDGAIKTLELQALAPIQDHNEMGFNIPDLIVRLNKIPEYKKLAKELFERDSVDPYVLTRALASYQRTLISNNSRFDDFYYNNNKSALTASEKRGWKLFSEELYCMKCHTLPYFTNFKLENSGLYKEYKDKGLYVITGKKEDIGKFKVPTLRNIELTDPFMHDGSYEYLEDVIDLYAKGGAGHVNQNPIIQPFDLTKHQKKDLVNFLFSLTDKMYLSR